MILTGMITWWQEQMRDLVPASLRSSLNRSWRPELIAATETADPSTSPCSCAPAAARPLSVGTH